ncbi:hypothetical protein [Bdellovibrio sp. HCB209]|uniref:hypothetical protein n=1 Tax=Bdellovibrio sp. HCB209 TaxID=3394354 RepID=UPI0039B41A17
MFETVTANNDSKTETQTLRDSYRDALMEFAALWGSSRPLKGDYPGFAFDRLPQEAQLPTYNSLAEWIEFFKMHSAEGRISDKQFLWRYLSIFRWKTHPDFFSLVDDDTSFEVHNLDGHQTYRSMSLMDCCSYTLDELVSIPWYELFTRDQSITDCDLKFQQSLAEGTLVHTDLDGVIATHQVSENFGFDKMVLTIKPLYLSPIYDMDGNVVGVISALKVLSSRSRRLEAKEEAFGGLALASS